MSFRDIRDQPVPLRLLTNVLRRDRVPNALLFWGPQGMGKRLTALEFAKAVNCAESKADACDACLSCRKIEGGNHPDVVQVAPLKKSRIIDVEAISTLIEWASLKPFESEWRVFLILEAERMRGPAQNHLLKTLEEPVGKAVFILVSEHPQFLLPTIRSRCQRVRFGALRPETVVDLINEQREIDDVLARSVAAVSQGQVSRALDLIDTDKRSVIFDVIESLQKGADPLALSEDFGRYIAAQKEAVEAAIEAGASEGEDMGLGRDDLAQLKEERLALADALARRDIMEMLYLLETWYRDVLVYSATGDVSAILNRDKEALLASAEPSGAADKIGAIEKARLYLERFLNEERVFRDLFFALIA